MSVMLRLRLSESSVGEALDFYLQGSILPSLLGEQVGGELDAVERV